MIEGIRDEVLAENGWQWREGCTEDEEDAGIDLNDTLARDTLSVVRSEERRVGQECVSTCRYRSAPYPSEKTHVCAIIVVRDNRTKDVLDATAGRSHTPYIA